MTSIGMFLVLCFTCAVLSFLPTTLCDNSNRLAYVQMITDLPVRLEMARSIDLHSMKYSLNEMEEILASYSVNDMAKAIMKSKVLSRRSESPGQLRDSGMSAAVPSQKCSNHTTLMLEGILNRDLWALQMIDALGKPPSGLLEFHLLWMGSFSECVNVTAEVYPGPRNETKPEHPFKGRYCRVNLPLDPAHATKPTPANAMMMFGTLSVGTCFPDSCNATDVEIILNAALQQLNRTGLNVSNYRFEFSSCQEENLEWSTKAIAALVVASIFMAVLCLGTLYDIIFIQDWSWCQDDLPEDAKRLINGDTVQQNSSLNIRNQLRPDEYTPLLDGDKNKPQDDVKNSQPGVLGKILLAFSMYSNGKKLLSTKQVSGSLNCIHGIRFLSMTWVIFGHNMSFGLGVTENFVTFFPPVLKRWTFMAIANATVSVDSFFTLSGLLVSYLTLKEMKKNNGKLNWAMFYFHRFWRLTPPYMFLMLIYVPLFPYLNNGPAWPQQGAEINQCSNSWWTNLLYINNLVKVDEMCMGWSWYLANDMQFFILTPLMLVPLFYSKAIGIVSVSLFLMTTTITAGVVSRVNNLPASMVRMDMNTTNNDPMAYFKDYYIKPWCRMGPYIVGLIAGYILYLGNGRVRMSKVVAALGWAVATASALAVLYGLYDEINGHNNSVDVDAFYNAVSRSVWGACVCWVIVACLSGYGGFVNTILSWKALIPLSRLTYCAYLVHPIVIYFYFFSYHTTYHVSDINNVVTFLGNIFISYAVAFILSLAFESPMMGLEKVIFHRQKRS